MSAVKSFLARGSLVAVALAASISIASADDAQKPNNVVALTETQVPALSTAASNAVDATGANTKMDKVDVASYAPELDSIATLQRQKQVLKLQVEVAQLKSELATAKYQAEHPGSTDASDGGSAAQGQASSQPPVPVNDILSPTWSVVSIQGVGHNLSAVLARGSQQVQVKAGEHVRGLGRVKSIRVNGVDVASASGTSFLPFSSN